MAKERHSDAKSHRVGRATWGAGVDTSAYRAVVAFACVQCGRVIASGELFSRQSRHTPMGAVSGTTTDPICVTCRPLRLETTSE